MSTDLQEAAACGKAHGGNVIDIRPQLGTGHVFDEMVGTSAVMVEIFRTIELLGATDFAVLILGETGTGKELVARAIHNMSRRKKGPFVPVNCGALPETILESELFGHTRGAFTGAFKDKKGRFELAHEGTIFLDEVGELPLTAQVKLLRVLDDNHFERVGGESTVRSDVRIVSATNAELGQQVRNGRFREDLYYRLHVVPIKLPPLRARRDDIPAIANHVLERIRVETHKPMLSIDDEAMNILVGSEWPGNVRQLINTLQYASIRCKGEEILTEHLSPETIKASNSKVRCIRKINKLTRANVADALAAADGNKVKAAKLLGVGRATLYRYLTANRPH